VLHFIDFELHCAKVLAWRLADEQESYQWQASKKGAVAFAKEL
jgi:hypothetical protein